jgi:hypothetical protein
MSGVDLTIISELANVELAGGGVKEAHAVRVRLLILADRQQVGRVFISCTDKDHTRVQAPNHVMKRSWSGLTHQVRLHQSALGEDAAHLARHHLVLGSSARVGVAILELLRGLHLLHATDQQVTAIEVRAGACRC